MSARDEALVEANRAIDRARANAACWQKRYREESCTKWDDGLPPGGEVCAAPDCGQPVGSEPCPEHNPRAVAERLRARLAELESAARRYRIAWRVARARALATGAAADRSGARAAELQTALQDQLGAVLAMQIQRDALQKRLHDAAMTKTWTNEDGKKFVFVEDIAPALLGLSSKATDEAGKDTSEGESTQPDFYQPGRTYISREFPQYGWRFRCDAITTHPEDGERTAIGWRYFNNVWEPYAYGEDDWEINRCQVTEAGDR